MSVIDRRRVADLVAQETTTYAEANPRSRAVVASAQNLLGGVPMTWMNRWSGGFPLSVAEAHGATLVDLDGHRYVDFALGDTGAMAGHSPAPTVAAIRRRAETLGGLTTMLTSEDAQWCAAELTGRFGVERWSFTLSASDANRFMLRLARLVTGRPRIACCAYSYHGSVDETFVVLDAEGRPQSRPGNVAPAVDPTTTTTVVEMNDLEGLARALESREVAVFLLEPAMTNIGIVLPEPGYLEGVQRICRATGTLLCIDETHTFSLGVGGGTRAYGLSPDLVTIGKAIAGGVPAGAYGLSAEVAEAVLQRAAEGADLVDVGGVGGTLAGNALSLAAMRATLGEVLTEEAFVHMIELATAFRCGVEEALSRYELDFSVVQLGARAEYRFTAPAPTTGTAAAAAADDLLDAYFHLYLANRGVLITPFHNMALMCPATTWAQVDLHSELFAAACATLVG